MVQVWKSKTMWANVIAAVSMFLGAQFGVPLTAEQSAAILALINVVLRAVTNEPIEWS
jgi:hypothetical protein